MILRFALGEAFYLTRLITDFLYETRYIPRAALLAILFIGGLLFFRKDLDRKQKREYLLKHWRTGLFLFYLSFILVSTLFAREITYPCRYVMTHIGFRKDIKWNNEIIENILFFIPYSILYLQAFHPEKPGKAALALSVVTTCFIEFSQLLFWLGDFQISDILYNLLGGIIGYFLWQMVYICKKMNRHRRRDEDCGAPLQK